LQTAIKVLLAIESFKIDSEYISKKKKKIVFNTKKNVNEKSDTSALKMSLDIDNKEPGSFGTGPYPRNIYIAFDGLLASPSRIS
jgi:hypothetical protein